MNHKQKILSASPTPLIARAAYSIPFLRAPVLLVKALIN